MASTKTAVITLLLLARIHCDTAVSLTTEPAVQQTASEPQYEGTLFTAEQQHTNDSVQTAGSSQLTDDRYTTDVDSVPGNVSGNDGSDAGSDGDTSGDWSTSNGTSSGGYHGRGTHDNSTGTAGNTSAYVENIDSPGQKYGIHSPYRFDETVNVASPSPNCTNLNPQCNYYLTETSLNSIRNCSNILDPVCHILRPQFIDIFIENYRILRSIYSSTQYKERRTTSLEGQPDSNNSNNVNTDSTQDWNATQQTSTSRQTGSQEYDGTEARRTNLSGFEQRHYISSLNCSSIRDPNCHIPLTTANVLHK